MNHDLVGLQFKNDILDAFLQQGRKGFNHLLG